MRSYLFSPGPSHLPQEVRDKLAIEPPHHRSNAFRNIFNNCLAGLKYLFGTKGDCAILTCSGSGAMEAAAVNFVSPGDQTLVIEGGKFGRRWIEICRRIGCETIVFSIPMGEDIDFDKLRGLLVKTDNLCAVFITQTETSSGALLNVKEISTIIREFSDAVIIADVVASLGSDEFLQDEWMVDAAVSCSQKGLMCPPGLGFVSVSPTGLKRLKRHSSLYWDLEKYFEYNRRGSTPFTPAINLIAALQSALEMILKSGIASIWQEKARLAYSFRTVVAAAGLEVFPAIPSSALTAFRLKGDKTDNDIIFELEETSGFRVSGGQEELQGGVIRVSHMGAVEYEDLARLIVPLFDIIMGSTSSTSSNELLSLFQKTYRDHHAGNQAEI